MKLFKVDRPNSDFDYGVESMICEAENADDARKTSPMNGKVNMCDRQSIMYWGCPLEYLTVTYIGEAAEGIDEGVICADFNAG